MRVYLAGPYTKGDSCINTNRAIHEANKLLDKGYAVFLPHLCHLWHTVTPRPYKDWIRHDLSWVRACDALIRLSGESSGADVEVQEADDVGIPVFYSVEDFFNKYDK